MRTLYDQQAELTVLGRWLVTALLLLSVIAVCLLCFLPQPFLVAGVTTPNIISWGRFRLLLVPFNTLFSLPQLRDGRQMLWVLVQNLSNIGLLFPTVFFLQFLSHRFRSFQKSLRLGFVISLGIECVQLLLDGWLDANRVFEIDDLWTNSLGAGLAYLTYRYVIIRLKTSLNP